MWLIIPYSFHPTLQHLFSHYPYPEESIFARWEKILSYIVIELIRTFVIFTHHSNWVFWKVPLLIFFRYLYNFKQLEKNRFSKFHLSITRYECSNVHIKMRKWVHAYWFKSVMSPCSRRNVVPHTNWIHKCSAVAKISPITIGVIGDLQIN